MSSAFPIQTSERRVRRLRLRSRDAAATRRASSTLDDALRTASIPEAESGRLLVIRRLALGRISANASSTTLALLVEQTTHIAADRALRFDQPGADSADALLFPSRADAIVALGRRLAQSESSDEWYWNQIVPGWSTTATRVGRWRILLGTAREREGSAIIAGALAHEAEAGEALDEFIAAVRPEDVTPWCFLAGWQQPDDAGGTPADAALLSSSTRARLLDLQDRLGRSDRRVTWLGAVLAVHAQPSCAALSDLPRRVATWLRRASEDRGSDNPLDANRREKSATHDGTHAKRRTENAPAIRQKSDTAENDGLLDDANHAPAVRRAEDNAITSCAGLFLLVNGFARLRFARYLARNPATLEAGFPARLLSYVARKAGVAEDDPVLQALAALSDSSDKAPNAATVIIPEALFKAWLTAIQRWCARHAAIDWRELILRPGRVHITRTQIEVRFAPEQAEIALRRLALDVDPGWVPWLGRVIRFHYVDPDERPR